MIVRRTILAVLFVFLAAGMAQADTDAYVGDLNIFASKQFGEFKADLTAHYGISGSRFDLMLRKVDSPGDLAVALWLGQKATKPLDDVVRQYRIHRGKGWGVIAKGLGIRPGTAAFHRLKRGDLGWYPDRYREVMKKDKKQKAKPRKKKKRRKGY